METRSGLHDGDSPRTGRDPRPEHLLRRPRRLPADPEERPHAEGRSPVSDQRRPRGNRHRPIPERGLEAVRGRPLPRGHLPDRRPRRPLLHRIQRMAERPSVARTGLRSHRDRGPERGVRPHPGRHEGDLGRDGLRDAPQAAAGRERGRGPHHSGTAPPGRLPPPGKDAPLRPRARRRGAEGEALAVLGEQRRGVGSGPPDPPRPGRVPRLAAGIPPPRSNLAADYQGRAPRVARSVTLRPIRTTSMPTASPIFFSRIAPITSSTTATGLLPTDLITSPTTRPAAT